MKRFAALLVFFACTEPVAHPPPETRPIERPETRPIERSIVRAAHALNKVCPSESCGIIRTVEDTAVHFAEIACLDKYYSVLKYNRQELRTVQREYGEDCALGIFAHEMGHHIDMILNGLSDEQPWVREYHADRWAGCMIATIRANPKPFEAFLRVDAASMTDTHPPGNVRAEQMLEGFSACSP